MGKINMGFFKGKLYHSCNRTFSLGNGENFIDETGPCLLVDLKKGKLFAIKGFMF